MERCYETRLPHSMRNHFVVQFHVFVALSFQTTHQSSQNNSDGFQEKVHVRPVKK